MESEVSGLSSGLQDSEAAMTEQEEVQPPLLSGLCTVIR